MTAAISTGFGDGQKQIQLQLQGPDMAELQKLADRVVAVVREVPGAVDVDLSTKGQKPELDVEIDRGLAGSLGVTVGQVGQALRPAFAGIDAGDWIDPSGETRDVTVRLAAESRSNVQFGSFLDPLSIMLSLPLSLIGVMLALLVTGSTLNLMSLIGVILLMGIVAKNAILLIDFAKWAEEAGKERRQALIGAGRVRLRPILMTTFAIVAGMVPVALGVGEGADFRAPLGIAVIGGVITSTILTLLVIPTVYEILADTRDWLGAKAGRGEDPGGVTHPVRVGH